MDGVTVTLSACRLVGRSGHSVTLCGWSLIGQSLVGKGGANEGVAISEKRVLLHFVTKGDNGKMAEGRKDKGISVPVD